MSNKKKTQVKANEAKFRWEELLLAKQEAGEAIMNQNLLIVELSKQYETKINGDQNLLATVTGLAKTLEDLAKDVNQISLEHATVTTVQGPHTIGTEFKKGIVKEGEDQMDYITIGAQYLSVIDKVAHLAGTAYLDVFTRLKVDTTDLKKAVTEGEESVKKINKEIKDGTKQ